jgi:hypothetical protein
MVTRHRRSWSGIAAGSYQARLTFSSLVEAQDSVWLATSELAIHRGALANIGSDL